jgi:glucose-6-phosphate 1-dehydrogenase
MLFARQDSVEAAWRVVEPVIGEVGRELPLHTYEPGSWGPPASEAMIPDGWHAPEGTG